LDSSSYSHIPHSWDDVCDPPHPPCLLGWGLANFLPRLGLNLNPPNLCFPSSLDDRREPPSHLDGKDPVVQTARLPDCG
jgi:hypothetical protein